MKKIKKTLAILLMLTMICSSMSVCALAEQANLEGEDGFEVYDPSAEGGDGSEGGDWSEGGDVWEEDTSDSGNYEDPSYEESSYEETSYEDPSYEDPYYEETFSEEPSYEETSKEEYTTVDYSEEEFDTVPSDEIESISGTEEETTTAKEQKVHNVVPLKGFNFVLFGLSGNNSGDDNRSDTIMICTIDKDNQELKFTSILRDTKAAIPGHVAQKINAAYKYGGADLALETLNDDFGLDLKEYVTIDFQVLIDIVDILGGIELEITEAEAEFINSYSEEKVSEGMNLLNGEQTMLYARIRKIDSDKVRAQRQQKVIQCLLSKFREGNPFTWIQIVYKLYTEIETSISITQMIELLSLPLGTYTVVQNVVPDIEYETDLTSKIDEHGEWVWIYDLEDAGDRIRDIINNPQTDKQEEES